MKYYFVEPHPAKPNIYSVHLNFDAFGDKLSSTSGSYAILASRILGLSFPEYVRLCINNYNATVVGKESLYPHITFTSKKNAEDLAETLNHRVKEILKF